MGRLTRHNRLRPAATDGGWQLTDTLLGRDGLQGFGR